MYCPLPGPLLLQCLNRPLLLCLYCPPVLHLRYRLLRFCSACTAHRQSHVEFPDLPAPEELDPAPAPIPGPALIPALSPAPSLREAPGPAPLDRQDGLQGPGSSQQSGTHQWLYVRGPIPEASWALGV